MGKSLSAHYLGEERKEKGGILSRLLVLKQGGGNSTSPDEKSRKDQCSSHRIIKKRGNPVLAALRGKRDRNR